MLDQNTDRMWYVIGAVIIGAAIILILNGTVPELFASVANTFKEKTESVTLEVDELTMTDGAGPLVRNENILRPEYLTIENSKDIVYDPETYTWSFTTIREDDGSNPDGITRFLRNTSDQIVIPNGESYTMSYEIRASQDILLRNDINVTPYVDGVEIDPWNGNNSDDVSTRKVAGKRSNVGVSAKDFMNPYVVDAGEWVTVSFTYYNTSPGNTTMAELMDHSTLGFFDDGYDKLTNVTVPHTTVSESVQIELRNVKGEFGPHATAFVPVSE